MSIFEFMNDVAFGIEFGLKDIGSSIESGAYTVHSTVNDISNGVYNSVTGYHSPNSSTTDTEKEEKVEEKKKDVETITVKISKDADKKEKKKEVSNNVAVVEEKDEIIKMFIDLGYTPQEARYMRTKYMHIIETKSDEISKFDDNIKLFAFIMEEIEKDIEEDIKVDEFIDMFKEALKQEISQMTIPSGFESFAEEFISSVGKLVIDFIKDNKITKEKRGDKELLKKFPVDKFIKIIEEAVNKIEKISSNKDDIDTVKKAMEAFKKELLDRFTATTAETTTELVIVENENKEEKDKDMFYQQPQLQPEAYTEAPEFNHPIMRWLKEKGYDLKKNQNLDKVYDLIINRDDGHGSVYHFDFRVPEEGPVPFAVVDFTTYHIRIPMFQEDRIKNIILTGEINAPVNTFEEMIRHENVEWNHLLTIYNCYEISSELTKKIFSLPEKEIKVFEDTLEKIFDKNKKYLFKGQIPRFEIINYKDIDNFKLKSMAMTIDGHVMENPEGLITVSKGKVKTVKVVIKDEFKEEYSLE